MRRRLVDRGLSIFYTRPYLLARLALVAAMCSQGQAMALVWLMAWIDLETGIMALLVVMWCMIRWA